VLTPAQAAVLTRLVGKIDQAGLVESQADLIAVAATMDPHQLGMWVAHQIATHCEPALEHEQTRATTGVTSRTAARPTGHCHGRSPSAAKTAKHCSPPSSRSPDATAKLDTRTAAQRRADALVELAEHTLRTASSPTPSGCGRS
jgi:hypothetical protein